MITKQNCNYTLFAIDLLTVRCKLILWSCHKHLAMVVGCSLGQVGEEVIVGGSAGSDRWSLPAAVAHRPQTTRVSISVPASVFPSIVHF